MNYKGFIIRNATLSGGKAGKGYNKTSTIQVREPIGGGDYLLKAQYRYTTGNQEQYTRAILKARNWVDSQEQASAL